MQVGCFGVETTLAAYMLTTMCRKVNERDLFALTRAGSSGMDRFESWQNAVLEIGVRDVQEKSTRSR